MKPSWTITDRDNLQLFHLCLSIFNNREFFIHKSKTGNFNMWN